MSGFDLHAGVTVGKKRRDRREVLCRYLPRPPLAADRLSWGGDGDVLPRLKTLWSDGTSPLKLTPVELLGRLAVLIPKPHKNQVLYTGVLSARHRWRDRVVPAAPDGDDATGRSAASTSGRPNPDWASLMARGLGLDVLACPVCDGRLRHLAVDHLGKELQPSVRKALRDAYASPSAKSAKKRLLALAKSLEHDHPVATGVRSVLNYFRTE